MNSPSQGWLRKKEAADYMGVSTSTVDRWVREGRLRAYYLPGGKTRRFRKADLDAAVAPKPDPDAVYLNVLARMNRTYTPPGEQGDRVRRHRETQARLIAYGSDEGNPPAA